MHPGKISATPDQSPDQDPEKFDLAMSESYSDASPVYLSEVINIYIFGAKNIHLRGKKKFVAIFVTVASPSGECSGL